MDTPKERVARGAALLDSVMPDWANEIDASRLDLRSACDCILGQLYDDYWDGAMKLFDYFNRETGPAKPEDPPAQHGFAYTDENRSDLAPLEYAWFDAIRERVD